MYNKAIFKRCFPYKRRYWYKNLKRIPLYFKLIHHLIKHGYDEYATWEVFDWFINTMKPILVQYRNTHTGYPVDEEGEEAQARAMDEYDADIDKMIALLDDMDQDNPKYYEGEYQTNLNKQYEEMYEAKDEFFKLFSKYFYTLWD